MGSARRRLLLGGLDFALAEIGQAGNDRGRVLGNFWEWSGGFGTWLYRVPGKYMDMNDPAHPWPAYPDATSAFYANGEAVVALSRHVRAIPARTNAVTGQRYTDDPAIMSWQLANEPRPGGSDAGVARSRDAYVPVDRSNRLADPFARRQPPRLARPRGHQGANGSEGHRPAVRISRSIT
jgi:mannan endo-1,4-beta-mannosidase